MVLRSNLLKGILLIACVAWFAGCRGIPRPSRTERTMAREGDDVSTVHCEAIFESAAALSDFRRANLESRLAEARGTKVKRRSLLKSYRKARSRLAASVKQIRGVDKNVSPIGLEAIKQSLENVLSSMDLVIEGYKEKMPFSEMLAWRRFDAEVLILAEELELSPEILEAEVHTESHKAEEIQLSKGLTPWTGPDTFEGFAKLQERKGNMPVAVKGRLHKGHIQFRGEFAPTPKNYSYRWCIGADKINFIALHRRVAAKGYIRFQFQTFKDKSGEMLYQAVWTKTD